MTSIAQRVAARWIKSNGLTADKIVEEINREAGPLFEGLMFSARKSAPLGNSDSVMVTFARVPKGSAEIDALNSPMQFMLHITDDKDYGPSKWVKDGPAPEKVRVQQFRGRGIKMRAKSGPPEAVLRYVIGWLKANAKILKGEG